MTLLPFYLMLALQWFVKKVSDIYWQFARLFRGVFVFWNLQEERAGRETEVSTIPETYFEPACFVCRCCVLGYYGSPLTYSRRDVEPQITLIVCQSMFVS